MDIFIVTVLVVRNYNDRCFIIDNDVYTDVIRVCNNYEDAIEEAKETFKNLKRKAMFQMHVKETDCIDEFERIEDGEFEYEFVCDSGSCCIKVEIAKPPVRFR